MIKPNELRIGNWIEYEGTPVQLDEDRMEVLLGARNYQDLQPIGLTPDILEAAGFNGGYGYWERDCLSIELVGGDTLVFNEDDDKVALVVKTEHLHQLQNLYFALTGEELEIKLPVEQRQ